MRARAFTSTSTARALTLHGVTLTNGFADADSCGHSHQHGLNHECRGGSIYAGLGASLSLVDVEIFRSRARHGGAVYAAHATVDVVHSVFEENRASEEGGAFYVLDAVSGDDDGAAAATTFAATESTFLYNVAAESGAVFVAGTATLTDVVFRDNEATEGRGGALRVDDGFASLLRCDFRANGAGANEGDVECLAACPSPSHGTCAAAGICFSCACAAPHVVDESASSSKKSSKLPVGEAVAKVEVLIIIHVLAVVLVAAAVACYRRRRAKDHDARGVELEGIAPRRAEPAPRPPRDDAEAPPDAATPLQDAAGGLVVRRPPRLARRHARPACAMRLNPEKFDGSDLTITEYPMPVLRGPCADIVDFDDDFKQTCKEMMSIMYQADGVGLAATQVGLWKRFFVYNPTGDRLMKPYERIVVNPRITKYGEATADEEEGCLSSRSENCAGVIRRSLDIWVDYVDERNKKRTKKLSGFEARVFQHEYDHIEGVLHIDRLSPEDRAKVEPELERMVAEYGPGGALTLTPEILAALRPEVRSGRMPPMEPPAAPAKKAKKKKKKPAKTGFG
ncbi:peptide deformylase [Aureococcus anophagefferens]|nr:peptide deformylase [Aureococcus anophagefferens]